MLLLGSEVWVRGGRLDDRVEGIGDYVFVMWVIYCMLAVCDVV